jgi:hypothetical protein
MFDMRALIAGLSDYLTALDRQVEVVRARFAVVERIWVLLSECYHGTAADEFRPVWEATEARFREYLERTAALRRALADRLDDLRTADRPTGRIG